MLSSNKIGKDLSAESSNFWLLHKILIKKNQKFPFHHLRGIPRGSQKRTVDHELFYLKKKTQLKEDGRKHKNINSATQFRVGASTKNNFSFYCLKIFWL